jgi:hypothetical protein
MSALLVLLVALALLPMPLAVRAPAALLAGLLFSFGGWRRSLKRGLLIRATPTSKIASAAKGYTELAGTARNALTTPLYDPIERAPCVWFEVETQKYDAGKLRWRTAGSARSSRAFALDDGTGLCLIVPGAAQLVTGDPIVVRERLGLRHLVTRIAEGASLYAIGHLERIDGAPAPSVSRAAADPTSTPDFERRVSALMREWKKNPHRFDANGDGAVDDAEMTRAREAARATIAARLPQPTEQLEIATPLRAAQPKRSDDRYAVGDRPVTHWLREPDDGKPYIVSALGERELLARERRNGWPYLVFFVALASCAALALVALLGGWPADGAR